MMGKRKTDTRLSCEHLVQAIFQAIHEQQEVVASAGTTRARKTAFEEMAMESDIRRNQASPKRTPGSLALRRFDR
jgi:hypothetical protein